MAGGWPALGIGLLTVNLLIFLPGGRARAHAGSSPDAAEEADKLADTNGAEPARCAGELRLVASVVNESRPQLSLAVLRAPAGARVLPLGGRLGDLMLVALRPHYAALRSSKGALCVLPVFDPQARRTSPRAPVHTAPRIHEAPRASRAVSAPPTSAAAPTKEEPKPRAHLTAEDLDRGLTPLGDGEFAISRELLLKALKNPGGSAAGAYFRPAERGGRSVGMEMRAVRDGSTLSRMGMKTGDIVQTINGIDVTNPLGMLDALRTAQKADGFTITIVRDGRPQSLRYSVR